MGGVLLLPGGLEVMVDTAGNTGSLGGESITRGHLRAISVEVHCGCIHGMKVLTSTPPALATEEGSVLAGSDICTSVSAHVQVHVNEVKVVVGRSLL